MLMFDETQLVEIVNSDARSILLFRRESDKHMLLCAAAPTVKEGSNQSRIFMQRYAGGTFRLERQVVSMKMRMPEWFPFLNLSCRWTVIVYLDTAEPRSDQVS